MYPGSLPLIFNGSVPGLEKMFNVRRCSMYTGVQFDRFHCILGIKVLPFTMFLFQFVKHIIETVIEI